MIKWAGECAKAKTLPLVSSYRVLLTEWGEQQTGRLHDELSSGKVLQTVSSGE